MKKDKTSYETMISFLSKVQLCKGAAKSIRSALNAEFVICKRHTENKELVSLHTLEDPANYILKKIPSKMFASLYWHFTKALLEP